MFAPNHSELKKLINNFITMEGENKFKVIEQARRKLFILLVARNMS